MIQLVCGNMLPRPPAPITRLPVAGLHFRTHGELRAYIQRGAEYLYPGCAVLAGPVVAAGDRVCVGLWVNGWEVSAETFDVVGGNG